MPLRATIQAQELERRSPLLFRWACLCLLLAMWLPPLDIHAEGPDYRIPGHFAWPWACTEGHIVTWEPEGHWAAGMATGIAFDFAMKEGTPLFAPTDGMAYFLRDERPFETNLGNYIEVVSGDWKVRLAHLRDPQSGERMVKAGELIGHSGSSGAAMEHLHLELLVREGDRWVRPDLARVSHFFGLATADLSEGAIVSNEVCPAQLVLGGEVYPVRKGMPLGEMAELLVPLRNLGLEPLQIKTVQVALHSPSGDATIAEGNSGWTLAGQASTAAVIPVQPNMPGTWQVGRVTCETSDGTVSFEAAGSMNVDASPLKLVGVSVPAVIRVGERIALEAWVENDGAEDFPLDDLVVMGVRPDGVTWSATLEQQSTVKAGEVRPFALHSPVVPQEVGPWTITLIGYQQGGQTLFFHRLERSFRVEGPKLVIGQMAVYPAPRSLSILLTITNVGTEVAALDAIEAWGWKPDGEHYFSMSNKNVTALAPGESALIRLQGPLGSMPGLWRLVEAGYWIDGTYYRMALPEQSAVTVKPMSETRSPQGRGR